jgi:hypothetical protein
MTAAALALLALKPLRKRMTRAAEDRSA